MMSSSSFSRLVRWLLMVLSGAGCGVPSMDREVLSADTSVYAVLEVVPHGGVGLEQDRVGPTRVLAVDLVPAKPPVRGGPVEEFEAECGGPHDWRCAQLAGQRGALLLRTSRAAPLEAGALQDWPVGETRELRGPRLDFHKLDGTPLMRLVTAPGEQDVRVEIRLVKKCPARVSRVRHAQLEGTGSGVIAVPKRVQRAWVELERPSCFAAEDVEPVLPTPREKQEAQAAMDVGEAYRLKSIQESRERRDRELAYREERLAAFKATAEQLARQPPLSTLRPEDLTAVERPLHPHTAALMQAAGMESLATERRCVSSRPKRGSCKHWKDVLIVTWRNGEVQHVYHPANKERLAHFKRAAFDAGGVLRVEAADPPVLEQARNLYDTAVGTTRKTLGKGDGPVPPEQVAAARAAAVAEQVRTTVEFAVRGLKPQSDKDPRELPRPETWSASTVRQADQPPSPSRAE